MSRILKRPMFRRGGSSNEGIMTGLVDRKKYNLGSLDKENIASNVGILEEVLREYTPKTPFPTGAVGAGLLRGEGFRESLIKPYLDYTQKDDAREAGIKGGAAKLGIGKALETPKALTTKEVKNISNQTLYGIEPGKKGFATNAQIASVPGAFEKPDNRTITLPDGKGGFSVMPYEEYKIQNTQQKKSKAVGTEFNILTGLVDRMQKKLPETKTGALGYGFQVAEGFADQIAQVAESFGVKENWKADDYDERAVDTYLAKKGFTESLEEGAASSAIMKGAVINLAYALAKIAEPGNPKLSEGDIIRQLDRIKYGGSRNTFSKSLVELLEQEKIRASETIKGFGLNPNDYLGIGETGTEDTTGTGARGMEKNNDPAGIR